MVLTRVGLIADHLRYAGATLRLSQRQERALLSERHCCIWLLWGHRQLDGCGREKLGGEVEAAVRRPRQRR